MKLDTLRTRAEQAVRLAERELMAAPLHDVQSIVRELQIHQIELEMQNEALRLAQLELESSQAQYRELFDDAPVGYALLNDRGQIIHINTAGLGLLGATSGHTLRKPLLDFIDPEDSRLLIACLEQARSVGPQRCEMRLRRAADGDAEVTHVRLHVSTSPSSITGLLVVLNDITNEKRSLDAFTAEARRRELDARMGASARAESLGLLAAGIAHEFNNLHVSVLGNVELMLLSSELSAALHSPATLIKTASQRASVLTRQLLVFAGCSQPRLSPLNLEQVVRENLELLRVRVSPEIALQLRVSSELPELPADREQLEQIVVNLVTNAAEALSDGGEISLELFVQRLTQAQLATCQLGSTAAPGEFMVLRVTDNGHGMDTATLQRIFDPFFSTKLAGRGLGMAAVAGIVHAHRGALRVNSQRGAGASFEVALPLAPKPVVIAATPPVADSVWSCSGPVLLIDDDDAVRKVLAKLLSLLGFEVTEANGGESGVAAFRHAQRRFRCVVLDWLMPGMSGATVLATLRELEPRLPVIVVSGFSTGDLAVHDQHVVRVQKPMTLRELRAAAEKLLDTTAARALAT